MTQADPLADRDEPLVDSHCHLDYFRDAGELAAVIDRARDVGVTRMVTICTKRANRDTVLPIAEAHDPVYMGVGVHPHGADQDPMTVEDLVREARHPKVVGIGETGLDYFYKNAAPAAQHASFRTHIQAARETGLPLIIHTREADADTIRILKEEGVGDPGRDPVTGVIHCFSTSRWLAEQAVGLGFHISLSGILTFPKSQDLRETVADLPADRLLVETDAPYLAPVPHRGRKNEPAHTAHTAACLADVRGMAVREVRRLTTDNFHRLFAKVPRADGPGPVGPA